MRDTDSWLRRAEEIVEAGLGSAGVGRECAGRGALRAQVDVLVMHPLGVPPRDGDRRKEQRQNRGRHCRQGRMTT